MPEDRIPARRAALVLDVTQAASEVSRLIHECRDLHLPVEPGVRDGRLGIPAVLCGQLEGDQAAAGRTV
jgi:hypothetical protein